MAKFSSTVRVLACASTGGHWQQLMQLRDALDGAEVTYACTDVRQADAFGLKRVVGLRDYSKKEKIALLFGLFETCVLLIRVRPDVVISTGAAPGLLCLFWGRLTGARTIWVDSIANAEEMSLSGKLASKFCHVVFSQWEHVAMASGPGVQHAGSVI